MLCNLLRKLFLLYGFILTRTAAILAPEEFKRPGMVISLSKYNSFTKINKSISHQNR